MVIGLTGGIGTGKSTVARRLVEKGYRVIDADMISRSIIEKDEVIKEILEKIDKDLFENGKINRKKLAQIVFKDEKKLDVLNSIMHPLIIREMKKEIEKQIKIYDIVIVDMPLIFEMKIEKEFDVILLVYASKQVQIKRIVQRDGRTEEEAESIINSQIDLEFKRKRSDYILENNGTLEHLYAKTDKILKEIEKDIHFRKLSI